MGRIIVPQADVAVVSIKPHSRAQPRMEYCFGKATVISQEPICSYQTKREFPWK